FPKEFAVFPDLLEQSGYSVGVTGKGWGPGNWKISGWSRNPAGPSFDQKKTDSPEGISANDYAANFVAFLDQKPDDRPFCFWFGTSEPHRAYKRGLGRERGVDPDRLDVPSFLPDTPEIREDLADY